MPATKLDTKYLEKPWGRTTIPDYFPNPDHRQIGEIWFDGPAGRHPPLLVKYIFTSERLSIQVHPNDAQARDEGLSGGKEECWSILDAEPDARLGVGLTRAVSAEELRAAALDGSIETLMDWKPVKPGDFFFIPAGTVHAIGAGITLVEVQQNVDVTYRLYDYGRPRELHLDAGMQASKPEVYALPARHEPLGSDATLLDGPPFSLELRSVAAGEQIALPTDKGAVWFIPVTGTGSIDGQAWHGSECWLIERGAAVSALSDAQLMVATL